MAKKKKKKRIQLSAHQLRKVRFQRIVFAAIAIIMILSLLAGLLV
jgi:hypothetical protein